MEGQGFRDRAPEFAEANAEILGISFDAPEANKAFRDDQSFPFPLLCDVDNEVGEKYGTKRGPDEQFAQWPKRMTFLIDPEGVLRATYEVKDIAGHPAAVLADIIAASAH